MVDYPKHQFGVGGARGEAMALSAAVACAVLAAVVALPLRSLVAAWVALALFAAVAAVVVASLGARARFGAANTVTLARAGGVAVFAGFAVEPSAVAVSGPWLILGAALLLLALDGVDGWLARRQGLESAFGARFDMEVDSLFILVLAAIALGLGKAGPWLLGLGLLRYGFLAAGRAAPWLAAPLPHSLRRKSVCVLQIAALAVLLVPPVEPPWSQAVAGAAFAALLWSFAVDIRWLARRRGP